MTLTPTERLAQWFKHECNGEWEHTFGITIETLDNPGWSIRIDLADTSLAESRLPLWKEERSECDWIHCQVESGSFQGFGGVQNLDELINFFLEWSTRQ